MRRDKLCGHKLRPLAKQRQRRAQRIYDRQVRRGMWGKDAR
jgi:hypothetical protein